MRIPHLFLGVIALALILPLLLAGCSSDEPGGRASSGQAAATLTTDGAEPSITPTATAEPRLAQTSPETDREALVALYNVTGGPNWTSNNGWLSGDVPISQWYGVTIDDNSRVAELSLSNNQLSGEIPPELGKLANLAGLDLSNNHFNLLSGEIPSELGKLANLAGLDLSNNHLSGEIPPELGKLANLAGLDLSNNQLSGQIPPELGNLASLEELNLFTNHLSGEIPPELGKLANLAGLDLSNNQLSGQIPPELGNLASLEELNLFTNHLSGEIPPELGKLANLAGLDLSNNQLSGQIPPELGNLASLEELNLFTNHLSGQIRRSWATGQLGKLTLKLQPIEEEIPPERWPAWTASRYNNHLRGQIPLELGNLASLGKLTLSHNQLSGV